LRETKIIRGEDNLNHHNPERVLGR
jgi:hypothetical protein